MITGSVSLGTSTVAFGDMNNTARFKAAAVYHHGRHADQHAERRVGRAWRSPPATTTCAVASTAYEDVIMTVAAAALPGAGTLVVTVYYQDYGV